MLHFDFKFHLLRMKNFDFAWQLLLDPTAAFQSLKEKPHFWFPLLTLTIGTVAIFVWFYAVVDFDWMTAQIMASNPEFEKMSAAQRAQTTAFMTKSVMMWGAIIGGAVTLPAMRLLEAIYFLLISKTTSASLSLKQWFALACWTGFPAVLVLVLMGVSIAIRSNAQMTPDMMSMLSLNELIFHAPMGNKWFTLLTTLTVLNPYIWWLTIVGVKVFTARSMTYCAVIVMTPYVLVYVGWVLFITLF